MHMHPMSDSVTQRGRERENEVGGSERGREREGKERGRARRWEGGKEREMEREDGVI